MNLGFGLVGIIVFSVAVWRCSKILTEEEGPFMVFSRLRSKLGCENFGISNQWDSLSQICKLLQCPYCLSIWVALFFLVIFFLNEMVYNIFVVVFFASGITVLIEDMRNGST